MFRISIIALFALNQLVLQADENPYSISPKLNDVAYAAPAKLKSYSLYVQAMEPHWLHVKQLENRFSIKSYTSYVARIVAKPTPIQNNSPDLEEN